MKGFQIGGQCMSLCEKMTSSEKTQFLSQFTKNKYQNLFFSFYLLIVNCRQWLIQSFLQKQFQRLKLKSLDKAGKVIITLPKGLNLITIAKISKLKQLSEFPSTELKQLTYWLEHYRYPIKNQFFLIPKIRKETEQLFQQTTRAWQRKAIFKEIDRIFCQLCH